MSRSQASASRRNQVRSFNYAHNSSCQNFVPSTVSSEDSLSQHTHGKVLLSSLAAGKVPGETGLCLLVRNGNLPALRALRGTRLVGRSIYWTCCHQAQNQFRSPTLSLSGIRVLFQLHGYAKIRAWSCLSILEDGWRFVAHRHSYAIVDTASSMSSTQWGSLSFDAVSRLEALFFELPNVRRSTRLILCAGFDHG
ncbi:hypothetical protein BDR05DRAFT_958271, partial [Suillus weaverae]